jgi:hypothetical protein
MASVNNGQEQVCNAREYRVIASSLSDVEKDFPYKYVEF